LMRLAALNNVPMAWITSDQQIPAVEQPRYDPLAIPE
jgi:hypothetical protein